MNRRLSKPLILHLAGAASLAGYAVLALGLRGTGQARDVLAFLGVMTILFAVYFALAAAFSRRPTPAGAPDPVRRILFWALLFRLALLPAGLPPASWLDGLRADVTSESAGYRTFLLYDNDVWRYLWDGHVASHGFSPYIHPPAELEARFDEGDPAAEALFEEVIWQDVFDNVSFHRYRSVYPPLAQLLFRALHAAMPGSVFALKLVVAIFDFGTCLVLVALLRRFGRSGWAVMIYAWNPLAVKEIAGSGHVDAMMIFFLVLAIHWTVCGRRRLGLLALAASILSKLTPVLLVGLFLRRARLKEWPLLALALLAGFLPYVRAWPDILRAVAAFSRDWTFNPGPWAVWKWLAEAAALPGRETASALSGLLTIALVAAVVARDDGSASRLVSASFLILGGYLVLSATVMPWYLLWVVPLAAVRPGWAWLALTWLALLSYLIYIDQVEHPWWLWTEYLVFFALLVGELLTYCKVCVSLDV